MIYPCADSSTARVCITEWRVVYRSSGGIVYYYALRCSISGAAMISGKLWIQNIQAAWMVTDREQLL